jgi:hypothetical protein
MSSVGGGVPVGMDRGNITVEAMKRVQSEEVQEMAAKQESSVDTLKEESETATPAALLKKQESVKEHIAVTRKEAAKAAGDVIPIEEVQEKFDDGFKQSHPEHEFEDLAKMQQSLNTNDKKDQILAKVKNQYSDPLLQKGALEFLLITTKGALQKEVKAALDEFLVANKFSLAAGENIAEISREAAAKGVAGKAGDFRKTYVDYISSPEQDAVTKYFDLKSKCGIGKDFKSFIKEHLALLGTALHADSASKSPSMERAELQRNMSEIKILQALVGVDRFFEGRV